MLRIGIALIPDILYTVYSLGGIAGAWSLHPVVVVLGSGVMLGLYVAVTVINIQITSSNGRGFEIKEGWRKVVYVEAAVQGVLGLCYAGILGASCVAINVWRKERKGGRDGVEIGVHL
jgi:hypothetical protein